MSTAARAFPYFPGLLLLAILPATSMLAAEPPQSTTATTTVTTTAATTVASAPHRTVAYGGRSVEVAVDAIDNPLVLMQTSAGDLVVELFQQEAPQTVATFLELANGTKAPSDPTTDSEPPHPYYDGLGFYRVINGFMIQAGNPAGVDDGNPAARFTDEISALSLGLDKMLVLDPTGVPNAVLGIRSQQDFQQRVLAPVYKSMGISSQQQIDTRLAEIDQHLRAMTVMALYELQGYHYRNELQSHAPVRGVLAVANGGPAGKGSQFFINLVDTPWLTGKHTVFGKVRLGMEIVDSIGKVAVDTNAHPLQPVTLLGIRSL